MVKSGGIASKLQGNRSDVLFDYLNYCQYPLISSGVGELECLIVNLPLHEFVLNNLKIDRKVSHHPSYQLNERAN